MQSADYAVAQCVSVLSHAGIQSKRLNFFHRRVATTFYFFCTKRHDSIPTGPPNRGAKCRCMKKIVIFDQSIAVSKEIFVTKWYKIEPWLLQNAPKLLNGTSSMTLCDLAKYSMTRRVGRSVCDSWASCYTLRPTDTHIHCTENISAVLGLVGRKKEAWLK